MKAHTSKQDIQKKKWAIVNMMKATRMTENSMGISDNIAEDETGDDNQTEDRIKIEDINITEMNMYQRTN